MRKLASVEMRWRNWRDLVSYKIVFHKLCKLSSVKEIFLEVRHPRRWSAGSSNQQYFYHPESSRPIQIYNLFSVTFIKKASIEKKSLKAKTYFNGHTENRLSATGSNQ